LIVRYLFNILHLGEEIGRARLGDSAKVVNEVLMRHADTGVYDMQQPLLGLRFDADAEVRVGAEHVAVRQRHQSDFVQGVRPVGD
jgi:hypothetical protein